ncbi:MAG: hypothetical protein WBY47_16540 [Desulfobacterales bacterium]
MFVPYWITMATETIFEPAGRHPYRNENGLLCLGSDTQPFSFTIKNVRSLPLKPVSPSRKSIIILRKKVFIPKKHYQLKLFSPNNGVYEYSAGVTDNKNWDPKELLLFVSGRSAQENSISELKTGFAFDHNPTITYQAHPEETDRKIC